MSADDLDKPVSVPDSSLGLGPPLPDFRYEQFARALAGGATVAKAYQGAGYNNVKGAGPSGARLLRNPAVRARVEELRVAITDRAVENAALTQSWVIDKLRDNVRRAMQETPVLDSEGNSTGVYQYQGAVANRALELLGKHLGMFRDQQDVSISYGDLSDAQLERLAALADSEAPNPGALSPSSPIQ